MLVTLAIHLPLYSPFKEENVFHFLSEPDSGLDLIFSTIALILFLGIMAYYLFPKAQRRRHRTTVSKHKQYDDSRFTNFMMERVMKAYNVKEETDDTGEEAEGDKDVYESPKRESANKNFQRRSGKETGKEVETGEEFAVEVKHKEYNDSRITDLMMERIMKAYGVEEETDEESDDKFDEEFDEETDEEGANPQTSYNNERAESVSLPVMYNEYDDQEKVTGLKAWFTPVQLPITLAVVWFVILGTIENFIPDARQLIPESISAFTFTILPILFLVGLSGLLGILFKQPNEGLEATPVESKSTVNILKIVIGWGGGIYFLISNLR
jgi:hypothetical protein